MTINIEISESDIPVLIKVYTDKKNRLLDELKKVDAFLEQLDAVKENKPAPVQVSFPQQIAQPIQSSKRYNPDWTWLERIKYIIEEANRPLTTTEIVNRIIKLDTRLEVDEKKVLGNVSSILSSKSKEGGIFRRSENERGALLFWIDKVKPAAGTAG